MGKAVNGRYISIKKWLVLCHFYTHRPLRLTGIQKKTHIKSMRGCHETFLRIYLDKQMWSDCYNDNALTICATKLQYNIFCNIFSIDSIDA